MRCMLTPRHHHRIITIISSQRIISRILHRSNHIVSIHDELDVFVSLWKGLERVEKERTEDIFVGAIFSLNDGVLREGRRDEG